jgi:uncharacterized protein DUF7008/Eco57I restriction-modification methylase
LQLAPYLSEREYLLTVFRELTRLPAAEALFDARHNLAWRLAPSAEGAKALLQLFRAPSVEAPAFRFGQGDTRFLGDLYQDLDDEVRERYALLQTPRFVESFILDRTLERSVAEFGLEKTTLIDPTCGSGHFLLGAFERLYDHRLRAEPGLPPPRAVELALEAVHGADLNPYSVAIARFRLALAAWVKCGVTKLTKAPRLEALTTNLVVADSLLQGRDAKGQRHLGDTKGASLEQWRGKLFALEDEEEAKALFAQRFSAVVGNPPYITVKDAALRETYRGLYPDSASGKYALAAPFTERFFELADDKLAQGGFVGLINANSFMKREFGKALIEYMRGVNLELIVNTSGAYIPGHGTPTVLLFGRHDAPKASQVLAVLAKRGEPSTPDDPTQGLVWRSIADHWSEVGFENDYVSVAKVERSTLDKHPWSLGGGGASELKELLEERAACRLGDIVESIGRSTHAGEDDAFFMSQGAISRTGTPLERTVPLVKGEQVRDWHVAEDEWCLFPYKKDTATPEPPATTGENIHYWRLRTALRNRRDFGQRIEERGLQWFEHSMFFPSRYLSPLSIAFAFVATHNHFAFDRGGKVFNRTAPIIKLREGATEDEHLALLAYLNSSTVAFYFRQIGHSKGSQGVNEGMKSEQWEQFLEYSGTLVSMIPLPRGWQSLSRLGRLASDLALERAGARPTALPNESLASERALLAAREKERRALTKMVAVQENLDAAVYRLWGLQADAAWDERSQIELGQRRFEIELRRSSPTTRWFSLNGYQRPELRAGDVGLEGLSQELKLIEQPEHKRRWSLCDWQNELESTLRERLLDAWEANVSGALEPVGARSLLDTDASLQVATERELSQGREFEQLAAELLASNSVPYTAALRFTDTGLEKRAAWQRTWDLQRREDADEQVGAIPVPPKYDSGDYHDPIYWRLRGKLDVPKERFISYPGCESDEDGQPVYGWAGWNHPQQAQALAALYQKRKTEEGWGKERLTPMLAGLEELVPWVKQWHNEPNDDFGGLRLGDYFAGFVEEECRSLGLTKANLKAWRPEAKRGKAKKAGAAAIAKRAAAKSAAPAALPTEREVAATPKRGRPKKSVDAEAQAIEKRLRAKQAAEPAEARPSPPASPAATAEHDAPTSQRSASLTPTPPPSSVTPRPPGT